MEDNLTDIQARMVDTAKVTNALEGKVLDLQHVESCGEADATGDAMEVEEENDLTLVRKNSGKLVTVQGAC